MTAKHVKQARPARQDTRRPSFTDRVYAVVRTIPRGETMTYGEVAEAVGRPGAARAVGNVLNKNRNPEVPCHRVVKADGTVGGYAWGSEVKRERLEKEGAVFRL